MSRVRMLKHFGITPYMVFDGDYLPSKAVTEVERAKKRQESRRVGLELHKLGRTSQAHQELQKAVDVTPQMARQLIEELKEMGVQYVVAPYEADAQLAYMERKGIINGILSEDSDLLVFGAKCLLTKLDQYGECVEINRDDFTACKDISLVGWSDTDFRRMAILSGCDYLPSISKMGLKKAYRLVRTHKTIDRILRMIQFDGQFRVPIGYLEAFQQAELTFLHQWVFCPLASSLVMNTDPAVGVNIHELSFVGQYVEQVVAQGVARGDLDPMTKEPITVDTRSKPTPRTPWTGKQQLVKSKSGDLKCGISIETFFKPKRTPLAEMDPNSFTPSPSQQSLLRRNVHPWSVSPVPSRQYLSQSAVSTPGRVPLATSSATSYSSTQTTEDHSFNRAISAARPYKRPRLCSGSHEGAPEVGKAEVEAGRSRFFERSMPKPCSSVMKSDAGKRSRRPGVNIWSDDSVEDIMADLPDITDTQINVRKQELVIIEDGSDHSSATGVSTQQTLATTSQSSETTVNSQGSASGNSQDTAATSIHSSAVSQSSANPFDVHVSAELIALREKFSYQTTQKPEVPDATSKSKVTPLPQPKLTLKNGSKPSLPPSKSTNAIIKPAAAGKHSLTPLQRLGVGALNRSRSFNTPLNGACAIEPVQAPLKVTQSTVLHETAATAPLTPMESAKVKTKPVMAINRGSEDLLVPDSEDDGNSEVSSSDSDEGRKPKLDLGRFAFTPSQAA